MATNALFQLARWLGPWAGDHVPKTVRRSRVRIVSGDHTFEASVYEPEGKATGAYFVAPGLHFLGPDDTRFDRFCRVLASAGYLVLAPLLPSYIALTLDREVFSDARRAFSVLSDRARALGIGRPAIFSISFGSSLAFDIATHPETRDDVGGIVVFGGFCDFISTVRFAVTGDVMSGDRTLHMANDPLNAPVVYLNVLPHIEVDGDKEALAAAWRTMVRHTWNRPELKAPGARDPFAHQIAERLPLSLRVPFLRGCGLEEGFVAWLDSGLERAGAALSFMDPKPLLKEVKTRVVIVHGRDDDVIPFVEADKLASMLPSDSLAGKFITGLYGHTANESVSLGALARELGALGGMLSALARAPRGSL